jgi:hypothetical protein
LALEWNSMNGAQPPLNSRFKRPLNVNTFIGWSMRLTKMVAWSIAHIVYVKFGSDQSFKPNRILRFKLVITNVVSWIGSRKKLCFIVKAQRGTKYWISCGEGVTPRVWMQPDFILLYVADFQIKLKRFIKFSGRLQSLNETVFLAQTKILWRHWGKIRE